MEFSVLEQFASLGLGAVLAIIVVYWKRQDDLRNAENIERRADNYREDIKAITALITNNTEAVHRLTGVVERLANYSEMERKLHELERRINR